MRTSFATVVALTAAIVTYAPAAGADEPASTPHATDEPTRVLIVGDSVTQGSRGDYTWRRFLWNSLEQQPTPVDFVGWRTGVFDVDETGALTWDYDEPDAYADPDFDQDHGAWFGGRIEPSGNYFYDPIGPQVAAQAPDIIVSMWGINDLSRDDREPADVIGFYRDWFAMARDVDPEVDFVVARLPYTWLYDGEVVEFNRLLGDLAGELTTDASHISVATMSKDYTRADDSVDYVHPNTSGQQKIAGMIEDALVPLLAPEAPPSPAPDVTPAPDPVPSPDSVLPPAPEPVVLTVPPTIVAPPPTQVTAPSIPRRVRAVRHGVRTVVTWRTAAGATGYVVRCGARRITVAGSTRTVLRSRAVRCSVRSISPAGTSPRVTVRVARTPVHPQAD